MGIEFKLTDRELPASPAFVLFLAQSLEQRAFENEIWADQRSEALAMGDPELPRRAAEAAERVMGSPTGRAHVARAYQLFLTLLTGNLAPLQMLQERYRFVTVNGIARTGGSYLTAELYRALGTTPECVPHMLAHDSFPDAGPFRLQPGFNSWVFTLKTLAEYLIMVELFFADAPCREGRIVVPKKLAQSAYAGALFREVFGAHAEHLLTLRHPAACCVSTYEKSGGLPPDGRFAVRSNIEAWCQRDLASLGCPAQRLEQMDYFEVYLHYWENYHQALASSGLLAGRVRVLAYEPGTFQAAAQHYHDRYQSGLTAQPFEVGEKARRLHPDWLERSRAPVERTAVLWERVGLEFPREAIAACW
jgi:hypothetical protein